MAVRLERCANCGLVLLGDLAARLWAVDQSIAELSTQRAELLRMLRAASDPAVMTAPTSAEPVWAGSQQPRRPRVEWSRRRVQNLLLSLGVLLLTVAALIFIAVNWGTLGAGGRAAVMAVVTLSAAAAATVAARRTLPATAESVAALTVALLIVDGVGLRRAGLADSVAPATFASVVSAAIAVLTAAWATRVRLRALGITALLAAELIVPLAIGTSVVRPAGIAAVYGLQVAGLLAFRFRLAAKIPAFSALVDTTILRVSTYIWWAFTLIAAVVATYGHVDQRSAWGPAELMALAAIAVWVARQEAAELHLALATATGIATFCGAVPHLHASWRAPAVEVSALIAAAAVLLIPTRVARASTAVVAATGLGALLTAAKPIAEALSAAPAAVRSHEVWNGTWPRIRGLRAADAIRTGQPWSGTPHLAVLVLAALATAVVLVPKTRATAAQAAAPTIAVLVVVNVILVPLEASWTLPFAVGWELLLGSSLLVAAVKKDPATTRVAAIVGAGFLVHADLWSLRSPVLTVTAVGVTLVAATVAALRTLAAREQTIDRLVLTTASAALVAVEPALIATYQGSSFEQVGIVLGVAAAVVMMAAYILDSRLDDVLAAALQAVVLIVATAAIGFPADEPAALAMTTAILIVAASPAIAVLRTEPLAPVWPALVQVLVCLETDAIHRWISPDADLSSRALILAAAAAAVSVVATAFQWLPRKSVAVALITGPSLYALAVVGSIVGRRFDPIWLSLLIGGVAAALIAAFGAVGNRLPKAAVDSSPVVRVPAAISSLLVLASSWVRLAESHVHSVEPYTLPAAVILLAAGHVRRRTDRDATSWACYGPGLVLGLAPTLIQALADPGLVRPVLVGVAALLVLVAGVRERLQAPLAVGAAVLAIDALVQLSPALAAAYDAVPRWTLIALAGALLLGLGVTYERRIRDLRALGRKFGELR